MRQNEVFPSYRKDIEEMSRLYTYLMSNFVDNYVSELCSIRGYVSDENNPSSQENLIREMKLGYCEIEDLEELKTFPESFGLISKKDYFILNGRFLIPVYDISGQLITLIGYFPDKKKICNFTNKFF